MTDHHLHCIKIGRRWTCLGGLRMERIFSASLFNASETAGAVSPPRSLADRCRDRWTDLAGILAAMPDPIEFRFLLAWNPEEDGRRPVFDCGVLAFGRGGTKAAAREHCLRAVADLTRVVTTVLDYGEFEPIADPDVLSRMTAHLHAPVVTEMRRRLETIHIGRSRLKRRPILGFHDDGGHDDDPETGETILTVPHLFPWVPSDDPWWRLVEVMTSEPHPTAVILHATGLNTAPESCRETAQRYYSGVEKAIDRLGDDVDMVRTMRMKASALGRETLERLSITEGPVIAGRVFVASRETPSQALLSVLMSSLDDPSVSLEQPQSRLLFRGGAEHQAVAPTVLMEPLDHPELDQLFSPREASAILRTPMPTDDEQVGFPLTRARTAPCLDGEGDDAVLGLNVHRGRRKNVRLAADARCRHCHIIGQTGSGKSTLMLHMILHDLRRGRGVTVIDPHGTLIQDVLLRYPEARAGDLTLVDMTDVDHPVGFNPLIIEEDDPAAYRTRRDLLIDELYGYIDRMYDLQKAGGPIFETHFRAMLGLLLGLEAPRPPRIPSLLVFRSLYTNALLRNRLGGEIADRDFMLEEFLREAVSAQGEAALRELAPYITSKFNRFISDVNLRNITCQNRTLDLERIVAERGVLLVHLGKGRVGEYAAGMLASQLVSRIQQAAMRRPAAAQDAMHCLYADEFQLLASTRFSEMLAEGRKFGLSVTMAHQFASQVPDSVLQSVLGNVGTNVLFRVGAQDAEIFAPLYSPTFGKRDLVSLANFRAYVRGGGSQNLQPFNVDVPPPPDGTDADYVKKLRQQCRKRHGRPRAAVEKEIAETFLAYRSME